MTDVMVCDITPVHAAPCRPIDRPRARTDGRRDGARDGFVVVVAGGDDRRRADARRDGWDAMAMGTRRTRGDVGGGARAERWGWG